jgi:hypothetical protein
LKKGILTSIAVLTILTSFGQNGARIQKRKMEYSIEVSGNELLIRSIETVDKEVVSLSNIIDYQLKESIITDDFTSIEDVTAYTLTPKDGGKYKKVKVKTISTEDYVSRGIFYSNTKRSIITFPSVVEGAILHSEVTLKHSLPQILSPFSFDDYLECDTAELVLRVDDNVKMKFIKNYFEFADNIKMTENKGDGETIFRWKSAGIPPRHYENNSGGSSCYSPHLIFHIASYTANNVEKFVLRHKEDLFNWYSGLIKDQELSEDYTPVLDSIKANSTTELELAENIFNWVQHYVKYIAYEDGLGGFIPRTPNSVIENRFGDCKDMAMLTKTMMNKCGLDCYIAWIGTRSKCYTYDGCPTPIVDNHMIAAFPSENGIVFIDPTSTYSEFGVPSSFIQGKEAMVRTAPDKFEIIVVPFVEAKDNRSVDKFEISIDKDGILGTGKTEVSGYEKIDYEYALSYNTVSYEELFSDWNDVGNQSFLVKDLVQENYNSNKGVIKSEYSFSVSNYVSTYNGAVYINPFIKKVIDLDFSDRKLDLVIDNKYEREVEVLINLKPNAVLKNTIESEHLEENGFVLDIQTENLENKLKVTYTFTCNKVLISVDEFDAVKSTLKKMKKRLKQQIEINYED